MSEQEPVFRIRYDDDKTFEGRRDNAYLYTHLGALAMYDHVFLILRRDEGNRAHGVGIYRDFQPSEYEQLSEYMMANDYPAVLNMPTVQPSDKAMYDRLAESQFNIPDFIPDDFEEGRDADTSEN